MIGLAIIGAFTQMKTAQAKEYHYLESLSVSTSSLGTQISIDQSSFNATKILNIDTFTLYEGKDIPLAKYISDSDNLCFQFVESVTPMVVENVLAGLGYQLRTYCDDYEITENDSYIQKHLEEVQVISTPVIEGVTVNSHKVTLTLVSKKDILQKAVKVSN